MIKRNLTDYKTAVIVITIAAVFSCNNASNIPTVQMAANEPIGIAEEINLKYTDSGILKANLLSPKMIDYTNREFGYNEFVDGITLYLYDDKNRRSKVVSDYAVRYPVTDLIDLQGNVVITTHDGRILRTEQLYYDESNKWLFTNANVEFEDTDYNFNGIGFDSDIDFKKARVLELGGVMLVKE